MKTKTIQFEDGIHEYEVECTWEESERPGQDDAWIPDMVALEVDGEYEPDPYSWIWSRAYDVANGED